MPRFYRGELREEPAAPRRVRAIASEAGCTRAQLALAWLLAKESFIVPIPGTRQPSHVIENMGAGDLPPCCHRWSHGSTRSSINAPSPGSATTTPPSRRSTPRISEQRRVSDTGPPVSVFRRCVPPPRLKNPHLWPVGAILPLANKLLPFGRPCPKTSRLRRPHRGRQRGRTSCGRSLPSGSSRWSPGLPSSGRGRTRLVRWGRPCPVARRKRPVARGRRADADSFRASAMFLHAREPR